VKVVYVTTEPKAGPVGHLRTLLPAVRDAGVEARVVCADEEGAERFRRAGVSAVALPVTSKRDVLGAARIWPHLRGADVVHTHDRRAGLLVRPVARMLGAAAVHTYHGLPHEIAGLAGNPGSPLHPGTSRARAVWLMRGYLPMEGLLSRFGTVVVPSHAVAGFLVEHGVPSSRVHVVPNGIDVRFREPAEPHDPPVVGTAAVLQFRKRVDVLLDACASAGRPLRVEIFGDGPLRGELEAQASRLGLDATFHGDVPDLRDRLRELDLFVLPSRDENLPMALLEAMAAAVPVVATRVGGVPELVEDGVSGRIVEPERVQPLAEAIGELLDDPERRLSLGRAGATRVAERFSIADVGRRMVRVYEQALNGREPVPSTG
jgi:glycosyltransferase involved in cell wall biosynthesis